MSRKCWIVMLTVLVITNGWWIYIVTDQAITIDYTEVEYENTRKNLELLRHLALDLPTGKSRPEILNMLKKKYGDHLIKFEEDESTLFVDEIGLKFSNDRLVEIVLMND